MDSRRLQAVAGWVLAIAGLLLAVASVTSVGEAQSWDVADAFAADAVRGIRRLGVFLGALGLAAVVTALPIVIVAVWGTRGSAWALGGWMGFAMGAMLFALALGIAAIAMPALGELAQAGGVSPQEVANHLTRQRPLLAAFFGANLMYWSWVAIGVGLARSGVFPLWLGWFVGLAAAVGWLSFLHVPVLQRAGAPVWPLAVATVGAFVLRRSRSRPSGVRAPPPGREPPEGGAGAGRS